MKTNKLYTAACIAISITVLGFTRSQFRPQHRNESDTSTTDTTVRNNVTTSTNSTTFDPNMPGGTATTSSTVMNPTAPQDFTVPTVPGGTTSVDYPTTNSQQPINSYTISTPESTST